MCFGNYRSTLYMSQDQCQPVTKLLLLFLFNNIGLNIFKALDANINLAELSFGTGFLPDKSIVIDGVVLADPTFFALNIDDVNTIRINNLTLCPNPVLTTTTVEQKTTTEEPTTTIEEPTTTPLPTCPYPIVIPYPKIPATIDLLKLGFGEGFAPPKRIEFVGFPTNTSDRFIIDLYSDGLPDETANILFHFNPRFNEMQVIRNTWSPTTGWGNEERYGGFPFKIGEPFVLEFIAAPKNTIIVHVDYKPYVNFSRDDLSKLSLLEVKLAIELSSVVLCPDKPITTTNEPTTTTEEPTTTTEEPTSTTTEPTTTTEEATTTTEEPTTTAEEPTTITEEPTTTTEESTTTTLKPTTTILPTTTPTKPPTYCPGQIVLNNLKIQATIDFVRLGLGTGFNPPKRIIIFGTPLAQPNYFNIHIAEPANANVLFHFSARFGERQVIRNTWMIGLGWGRGEIHGGFPFKAGEPFVLEFVAGPRVIIHDLPVTINLTQLSFGRGFLPNKSIVIHGVVLAKPNEFVETPTVLHIEKLGFGGPSATPIRVRIIIRGTPLAQPESFNINFGTNGKMLVDGNVLFHFSPRFDIKQVIRNTWTVDKGWEQEERSGGFPFKVGEQFDVEFIISTSPINTIEVYVNNNFFVNFARYNLNKVTHMQLERAIQIDAIYACPGTLITDIPDKLTTTSVK
uniref:Galectin domain-containing protein n=1 Tax=Meloidogyne javanica TaxID=6303 RepID=A0A915NCN7_MELJA